MNKIGYTQYSSMRWAADKSPLNTLMQLSFLEIRQINRFEQMKQTKVH